MSLTTVLTAFAAVAVLFLAVAFATHRRLPMRAVWVVLAEAFVLTLLAALWFGSLGHGGWLLVFLLLGMLVAGAERGLRLAFLRSAERPPLSAESRAFLLGMVRYVAAGALLAWRLG